ncbi:MAG: SpoIIE family protein phosphatase [Lachnospiraceae bacterium]|jgi:stage II sporulation protein E|nr:SpoIIE family protein phosphatase [Lachnospiraceae bacterium]
METNIQDYERQRLLEYADSFQELADSFQHFRTAEESEKVLEEEGTRQVILWERQLSEQRSIFAGQLQEMSRMLSDIARQERSLEKISEKKYRQLVREMKTEGILVGDLFYIRAGDGHREYSIQMRTAKASGITSEDVAGLLSVLLDMRLVPHRNCPFFLSPEWGTYVFQEEPSYHVLTGTAKAIKQSEAVSGDCFECFEYGEGNVALLLSDGMGSGDKALKCSSMVVDLMQRFLEAGFSMKAAMRLVNGVLLTGETEHNTSTIDCCNIDLYQGLCHFCKVGAAPSYLKRDNLVEQISSRNLPLGLVEEPESESVTRYLEDGDYIVLLSDGVVDAMNQGIGEAALPEIISRFQSRNPSELANDILGYVLRQCKGEVRDDMTVLVTGFWERTR